MSRHSLEFDDYVIIKNWQIQIEPDIWKHV